MSKKYPLIAMYNLKMSFFQKLNEKYLFSFSEGSQEHENFPMSRLLKESVLKTQQSYPDFKFSSYSLRLAAQETRWGIVNKSYIIDIVAHV